MKSSLKHWDCFGITPSLKTLFVFFPKALYTFLVHRLGMLRKPPDLDQILEFEKVFGRDYCKKHGPKPTTHGS
jgi:hypothetical protein